MRIHKIAIFPYVYHRVLLNRNNYRLFTILILANSYSMRAILCLRIVLFPYILQAVSSHSDILNVSICSSYDHFGYLHDIYTLFNPHQQLATLHRISNFHRHQQPFLMLQKIMLLCCYRYATLDNNFIWYMVFLFSSSCNFIRSPI